MNIENENKIILNLIEDIRKHKIIFTNIYNLNFSDYEYYKTDFTLMLLKKESYFKRVYVISSNKEDFYDCLNKLEGKYVINIPTRKIDSINEEILLYTGFKKIATYKRYYYNNIKKRRQFKGVFAKVINYEEIKNLLNANFSPITGYLPDETTLKEMINNNNILINKNSTNGNISGVIGFKIENNKCYIPFWIDLNGNGLTLLLEVFGIASENRLLNIWFWVNQENEKTIKLHERLGAKHDGLLDYVYLRD